MMARPAVQRTIAAETAVGYNLPRWPAKICDYAHSGVLAIPTIVDPRACPGNPRG